MRLLSVISACLRSCHHLAAAPRRAPGWLRHLIGQARHWTRQGAPGVLPSATKLAAMRHTLIFVVRPHRMALDRPRCGLPRKS
jgi:hypothetical protein